MSDESPSTPDDHEYANLEKGGLDYVKREKNYLKISITYPIFSLAIQFLNLLLIPLLGTFSQDRRPNPFFLFDMSTPALISFVVTAFFLINAIFSIRWKRKVENYERLSAEFSKDSASIDKEYQNSLPSSNPSLTVIFYEIVKNMEVIRKLFKIVNIFLLYNVTWFIHFAFTRFRFGEPSAIPPTSDIEDFFIIGVLNILNMIGMAFYLIYEWKHFFRWNKKLKKLKEFEKRISTELDL